MVLPLLTFNWFIALVAYYLITLAFFPQAQPEWTLFILGAAAFGVAIRMRPDIIHGHLHEGALIGGIVARILRRPLRRSSDRALSSAYRGRPTLG